MFYQFHHLGSPDYLKIEKNVNFSFPSHLHHCFEIIILLDGQMQVTVDGKNFTLDPGEAALIFPNQIHELYSTESRHILCIFSPGIVQAYATRVSSEIPLDSKFIPDAYLTGALERLTESASLTEKKGVLYSLCGQFDSTAVYQDKLSDNDSLLRRIFSFVEENHSEDCSLSRLSHAIGYNYSYLSRFFRKIVGISFNAYVNRYRLSRACYLMENSNAPIIRCAYDSGYSSLRSFNRNFKEFFHLTPEQYRQRAKR